MPPVRGSFITAAVSPTPEEPLPVVYWPAVVLSGCVITFIHLSINCYS